MPNLLYLLQNAILGVSQFIKDTAYGEENMISYVIDYMSSSNLRSKQPNLAILHIFNPN